MVQRTTTKDALHALVIIHALLTVGYSIPAFMLSKQANFGFCTVLSILLLVIYGLGSFIVAFSSSFSEYRAGLFLGGTLSLIWINLVFAVYWSQMSNCDERFGSLVDQYSCDDTDAMSVLAVVASLNIVIEVLILLLYYIDFHTLFPNFLMHTIQASIVDSEANDKL